jgi:predicted nuclease of restriction endonuclease-like (RecB) superfamily
MIRHGILPLKSRIKGKPIPHSTEYRSFLIDLKKKIVLARVHAARSINRHLVGLYWSIGQSIVEKQSSRGWGQSVVEALSKDLQREFPGMRGFSAANLWAMRRFYVEYTDSLFLFSKTSTRKASPILQQLVEELPWGHHLVLLEKVKEAPARLYYIDAATRYGWSRNVLLNQIMAGAYERSKVEKKTHNFKIALPPYLAEQADEALKSSYNLEFLGINRQVKERQMETRLIERVQKFILELGYGFCFIGKQYRLTLGNKDYFIDLLFYHRFLKALVAIELKVGAFLPEYAGKMDFYLNVLNEKEKADGDNPSIGIILCAKKEALDVEFSLKSKSNPIGVAAYHLTSQLPKEYKGQLPTEKQLFPIVRAAIQERI